MKRAVAEEQSWLPLPPAEPGKASASVVEAAPSARARPPRASLLTPEEAAAHAALVETWLGDKAVWRRYAADTTPLPAFYEFFCRRRHGPRRARARMDVPVRQRHRCEERRRLRRQLGRRDLMVGDVASLTAADLPGGADLAWASLPRQDLSLAGDRRRPRRRPLRHVLAFWRLMQALRAEGRAPS